MTGRGEVGRVDLHRIVPAASQSVDIVVGQVRGQLRQFRKLVEEVLAIEASIGRRQGLELAVDRLVEGAQQQHLRVARKEWVPVAAP